MSDSALRSAASMSPGDVSRALQTVSIVAISDPSDRAPRVAVEQDPVGLDGTLRPGLVLRQRPGRGPPAADDRIADLPLGLHLVVAGEERRVAAHRVED